MDLLHLFLALFSQAVALWSYLIEKSICNDVHSGITWYAVEKGI
jgi:hypothetical protein